MAVAEVAEDEEEAELDDEVEVDEECTFSNFSTLPSIVHNMLNKTEEQESLPEPEPEPVPEVLNLKWADTIHYLKPKIQMGRKKAAAKKK